MLGTWDVFFSFPILFQSGDSPLFLFLTESMGHEECEPVSIYFSKINRTVPFSQTHFIETVQSKFQERVLRKWECE